MTTDNHSHPDLEQRVFRLEDRLLAIDAAISAGFVKVGQDIAQLRADASNAYGLLEDRLDRIERLLEERLGRNGPTS